MFLLQYSLYQITLSSTILIYQYALSKKFDGWNPFLEHSTTYAVCDGEQFLGLFGQNDGISRFFYNLPSHYELIIEMNIWKIDSWDSNSIIIKLDGQEKQRKTYEDLAKQPNICYGLQGDVNDTLNFVIPHSRKSAFISISSNISLATGFWGLASFKIQASICPFGCVVCTGMDDTSCLQWHLHSFLLKQQVFSGLDGWQIFSGAFIQSIECNCKYINFELAYLQIFVGFYDDLLLRFQKSSQQILVYINDKLILTTQSISETVQIQTNQKFGQELIIKLLSSYGQIRDFELYYSRKQQFELQKYFYGCKLQFDNQCIQCENGWKLNIIQNECEAICGDGRVNGSEECDDNNQIQYDGCYQCKYQCDQYCYVCQYGQCIECQYGLNLNEQNKCVPICGDKMIILFTVEQCDDGNNNQGDGCFNCIFECNKNCQYCNQIQCFKCFLGYELINQSCYSICGDGIVISEYEQCDDGNLIQYDGCYDCQYQCEPECIICDKGECKFKCDENYHLQDDQCIPICGDQIVLSNEECDDGNQIQFDGCYQCKYSCPIQCVICYQGACLEQNLINDENITNLTNNCGDGIVSDQEECDDQNSFPLDGCYNCKVQRDWICSQINEDSFSECAYQQSPYLSVIYLYLNMNKQYVKIQYFKAVSQKELILLTQFIKIQILDLNQNFYNITLIPIEEVKNDKLKYLNYTIQAHTCN